MFFQRRHTEHWVFSSAEGEDVKSIYDLDNRLITAMYHQQQVATSPFTPSEKSSVITKLWVAEVASDRSLVFPGPRLRQHHSHHQKPSVERHWAASGGKPNREKYPWLSAPVCQGRNVEPNRNTAHQTMNWPLPTPAREIWVHPLQAPQHVSCSFVNPPSWLTRVTGRVGLYSEIYTARSHFLRRLAHRFPARPPTHQGDLKCKSDEALKLLRSSCDCTQQQNFNRI